MRISSLILGLLFLLFFSISYSQKNTEKPIFIKLEGNHKTKPNIILREIEFSNQDSLSLDALQEKIQSSKLNLMRTQLFNFVNVKIIEEPDRIVTVFVFQERWYYWVYPILEHSERNLSTFIYYRDLSRVNYGLAFDWYNFRGRDEVLRFKTRLGFKEHYAISYHKPGFGKRRVDGLWVFANLFRQKKSIYGVSGNLPIYAEDGNNYIKSIIDAGLEYSYRPEILYQFEFGLKYQQYFYNSNIFTNPESTTPFNGICPKTSFKFDNRNSLVYPTKGLYVHLRVGGKIPLYQDYSNTLSLTALVQKNTSFGASGLSLKNEFFVGNMLYEKDRVLMFDEMHNFFSAYLIRGYEYYYFPSSKLLSLKNTASWKVFDFKLNIFPKLLPDEFSKFFSKVYLEAFSDIAYSESFDYQYIIGDNFSESFVYSIGAGVSIETYYDRLLQFHVAYNSCFDKFGIFAEFRTPIYKKF